MNGTRHTWFTVLIACTSFGQDFSALAQDGPAGITVPRVFQPFDQNVARCDTPPSLNKALGFAQDNEREFIQGIARGLAMAAKDRGLAFSVSIANNDAARMIEQVEGFRSARAGGLVVAPVDPASLAPALRRMIWKGAYVGAVVPPPYLQSDVEVPEYQVEVEKRIDEVARFDRALNAIVHLRYYGSQTNVTSISAQNKFFGKIR